MTTTLLAVHAFQLVRPGVSTPVWRSDAWLNRDTRHPHLTITVSLQPIQLDLFEAV